MSQTRKGFVLYVGAKDSTWNLIQETSELPVIQVADAFEASDICLTTTPKAVVIDRWLPKMGGDELLEHFDDAPWADASTAIMVDYKTHNAEQLNDPHAVKEELCELLECV